MLVLCGLIIFELAVIAVLLFVAIRIFKKQGDSYGIDMAALFASLACCVCCMNPKANVATATAAMGVHI